MMFSVGQTVLYGANGVCHIQEITTRQVGKVDMEYYVLKPVWSQSSTLFVPTKNEQLVSRIRRVKTADEIRDLLAQAQAEGEDWIDNKLERAEHFKEVISGEDCLALMRMVRLIHAHEKKLSAHGKRLHMADERFLREAEKMVGDEVATALKIDRDEAVKVILT